MAKRHTRRKSRKSSRRSARRSARRSKRNGGGWSDGPDYILRAPGNLVHHPYPGPGKDCTGNPESIRPGEVTVVPKGLPGLSGGKRHILRRKRRGGKLVVADMDLPPVSQSITPPPGWMANPSGTGGSVAQPNPMPPVVMSMPGVPAEGSVMKGGRYGFFPAIGPLNPENGVGVSPPPFGRIPCETGTHNPLNPNPNDIQGLSTAPSQPPYVTMKGGAQFPVVTVGATDAMRYEAPTAGYRNDFQTFSAPSPVPGLMIQTPYDARAFNPACIKTGGARRSHGRRHSKRHTKKYRNRRLGGAAPVGFDAGKFTPLTLSEVTTRKDFDGTNGLLPVKWGGKHKSRKHRRSKRSKRN
jgi:hypothetical protein